MGTIPTRRDGKCGVNVHRSILIHFMFDSWGALYDNFTYRIFYQKQQQKQQQHQQQQQQHQQQQQQQHWTTRKTPSKHPLPPPPPKKKKTPLLSTRSSAKLDNRDWQSFKCRHFVECSNIYIARDDMFLFRSHTGLRFHIQESRRVKRFFKLQHTSTLWTQCFSMKKKLFQSFIFKLGVSISQGINADGLWNNFQLSPTWG